MTNIQNPRRLFLLDASGAILSAFLLGVILVKLESVFGIPAQTLQFLAVLPCTFVLFDLYSYFLVKENIGPYLKAIAYINVIYCCMSFGLLMYHQNKITVLGWTYVLMEISIVSILAFVEFKNSTPSV